MKLVPKVIPEADWRLIEPARDFALRSKKEDEVILRLGPRQGVLLAVGWMAGARMVQLVDFDTGVQTPLKKAPDHGVMKLGRTSECDLKISSPLVSRQHMQLIFEGDIVVVRDLGSTNKSYSLKDNKIFDIASYLDSHSIASAEESTLDSVHETFGPALNDFLKRYTLKKEKDPEP